MSVTTDNWDLPFIPEELTPLRFTPSWAKLNPAERLRYNQIHGLYFHEQIIYFEQCIIVPMLQAARPHASNTDLRNSLVTFVEEENRHSAGFHKLLSGLKPDWYQDDWRRFVHVGPVGGTLLRAMLNNPQQFPFLIWLVQLLEERSMFASRLYLAEPHRFPASIVAIHRQHLMDEADHVQWDTALLNQFWGAAPSWLRQANARLLSWMLGEFIAVPRRAALRVIDALAAEMPELSVPTSTLKSDLRALASSSEFRQTVFGRDAVPRTWKQAKTAPDMSHFVSVWLVQETTVFNGIKI